MATTLLIVGGGKMGEALADGLLAAGAYPPDRVAVVEALPARRRELEAGLAVRYPGLTVLDAVGPAAGAVIAVKPADVAGACAALVDAGVSRVLSIAAGVTIAQLEGWLGGGDEPPAVVRAMPNTPAVVQAGAAALASGTWAGPDDVAWAEEILDAVGTVVRLPESALDAVTGLSGSGPAYVFLLAEALIDAGVLVGLARPVAKALAVQTVFGAAALLAETGDEPAALRASVTSPGGTTAAGLRALEAAGLRSAVLDAVAAATARSRELGSP